MNYKIGLDIGVSSCGWSVINLDNNRIEDLNVRIFNKAETDGKPLAEPYRNAKSARKRGRRKKHRINRIRSLMVKHNLITKDELCTLYEHPFSIDVWELRVQALERKLSNQEFVRILIHLAQRRGFKSNRKGKEAENDGKMLMNIKENHQLLADGKYRTVAEMMIKDDKFINHKRNKDGDYLGVVTRNDLLVEIKEIFEKQRSFANAFATESFEEKYIEIWGSQRPVASKEQIHKMIGTCTFEKREKRAPKASYSFQYFELLQKVNNLRFITKQDSLPPTKEQREKVIELAFSKNKVSYKDIREALTLSEDYLFNYVQYETTETDLDKYEKETFIELTDYHTVQKMLDNLYGKKRWQTTYDESDFDTWAYALTVFKDDKDIREYLQNQYHNSRGKIEKNMTNRIYEDELIDSVLTMNFTKFGRLSFKAIGKLIPYLEKGMQYDEACEAVGYSNHFNQKKKHKLLPVIPQVSNPVVHRALSETRKVVNAIIKRYGSPVSIYIETARELPKTSKERDDIKTEQKNNKKLNEDAVKFLLSQGIVNPKGLDIVKYKLWKQQDGFCMYSNEYISPDQLFKEGYCEVDHIIPYSRSLDDSYNNKVLVLAKENQNKRNYIPYEYFGNASRWEDFEKRVTANSKLAKKKKRNLLRKHFNRQEEREFTSKQLNDTRNITSDFAQFVREHLEFAESTDKKKVHTMKGMITAHLRSRWGFNKNRDESDLHHALDAVIVAVTTESFIQQITNYYKLKEVRKYSRSEQERQFPQPWLKFREEVEARMSENPSIAIRSLDLDSYDEEKIRQVKPIFISRSPRRKITGKLHQESIRAFIRKDEDGMFSTAKKTKLEDINFKSNGDFDMYGKETDPYTYEAIKQRLLEHGNDPKKAFKEKLYKPTKSGKQGQLIKSVKIIERRKKVRAINGEKEKGIVYDSDIVRTDVFQKDGKFYCVPIYAFDIGQELPNKAITARKPYDDWEEIDDKHFIFSLYPNDVVKIVHKNCIKAKTSNKVPIKVKEMFAYYKSIHRSNGGITVINHDNSIKAIDIGTKTLIAFEKYQVDILGNLFKVKEEKRRELETYNDNPKSKVISKK